MAPTPGSRPAHVATGAQSRYWARNRRLSAVLFLCWLAITFGVVFFARELSGFTLFGWPFSYYMVAQGTTLLYLLIVGVYAWRMRHLDRRFQQDTRNAQTDHAD
jgi:putative solute:sodium symporter small subunit